MGLTKRDTRVSQQGTKVFWLRGGIRLRVGMFNIFLGVHT